jgi:hypothetical protein
MTATYRPEAGKPIEDRCPDRDGLLAEAGLLSPALLNAQAQATDDSES